MSQTWKEIPKLDTLDFDVLVKHRAKDENSTESDVLRFISTRMSLQAGLELLGVPLIGGSRMKNEKDRSAQLLQSFDDYLIEHGYDPPELMWEPGRSDFDPILNEEAHRIGAEKANRRMDV